jgi:hypothetical protein
MLGTIIYVNPPKGHGLVAVTADGIITRYFLPFARIARSPEVLKVGMFVKFEIVAPPPKPGMLPIALGVEVSDVPFIADNDAKAVRW